MTGWVGWLPMDVLENTPVRVEGLNYGVSMHGLKLADVELDSTVLADLAMHEGAAFSAMIARPKAALPQTA